MCNGELEKKKVPYSYYDIYFGKYDADVCKKCGEAFFTEEASDTIDARAKELGLWGLKAKTRVSYSGNSLMIRVAKDVAKFVNLKKGEAVIVRPAGKKKLIVEIES